MKRIVWLAGLLLLVGLSAAEAAIQVEVEGDRVTLKAENAPLQEILQTIAAAGKFSLYLEVPLTEQLTVQIEHQPLLDALGLLLHDYSILIQYTQDKDRVLDVEVLASAASPPPRGAEAAAPGEAADVGETLREAEQVLVTLVASPEIAPTERIGAALALAAEGQAGTGQAALDDLLRTHQEPAVREQALAALASLPTVPIGAVASAALNDSEPAIRRLAVALLGAMAESSPQAGDIVRQVALLDGDGELRDTARALLEPAQSGTPSAHPEAGAILLY